MRTQGALQGLGITFLKSLDDRSMLALAGISSLRIESPLNEICDDLQLNLKLRIKPDEERIGGGPHDQRMEFDVRADEFRRGVGLPQSLKAFPHLLKILRAD